MNPSHIPFFLLAAIAPQIAYLAAFMTLKPETRVHPALFALALVGAGAGLVFGLMAVDPVYTLGETMALTTLVILQRPPRRQRHERG